MLDESVGDRCNAVGSIDEAVELLRNSVKTGDLILTIGAGEAYKAGDALVKL